MRKIVVISFLILFVINTMGQLKWTNVDSQYQPLPSSVHVYTTNQPIDTGTFRAYYLIADIKDKKLLFDVDTTLNRRLTPTQFYQKNKQPLAVVNCTFFSFQTNQNLNVVIKDGNVVSHNLKTVRKKYTDTTIDVKVYRSAIGFDKKKKADVAWVKTDSSKRNAEAAQNDPSKGVWWSSPKSSFSNLPDPASYFAEWKMQTAVGGGPVLIQKGLIKITNEEEVMFTGKAINDKHPRTAMGYTKDGKLIILVVQGRSESSGGATLIQEAQILKDLGCWEALNLDGGGSSCLLINGKETIKPSDPTGQRAVPAVFLIRNR